MDKNRLRDAACNNIVTIMFIVLCAVCMAFSGYAPNYVLYELFGRLSRNMFIVLSLIIPIVAGMGINFAITIGAMAAQIACLLVLEWGVSGIGGLALALCLYAKDHGLPLPAGIITMSPWTDVSLSGASYEENYTIDPLFGNSKENMLYQCSYIGNANPKNPYLSPLFGDFEGFPPMLMQVGAYEVLLDDTRAAAKKARAEGVKVRCSVYDGMFHVFQMGLDLIPESREAWEEVAEYLRIIYRIHREPEGTVVKKVKTRRKETEDRARLNLLAFLKRELKK